MRRRLLAAFLILDGLCALALPAAGALFSAPASAAEGVYVEIAGTCVEALPTPGADVAGRPVAMHFCAD